jgi:uncharacterized membrane protein YphA (DoxX/SURF4 family)
MGLNDSRLPHSLRLVIFFLRLALGLNFFYLGFSTLFDPVLGRTLRDRSLSDLYAWLSGGTSMPWLHIVAPWIFMLIGVCLIIGFLTRFMSIIGMFLGILSYLPIITYPTISIYEFISNEIIIVLCLLILIFSNAGKYFGIDAFFHFSKKPNPDL